MKHLVILMTFLFTQLIIKAQTLPLDSVTRKVVFQETIAIDTLSKEDLYERSIAWLTSFYKTSKFDVNDKTNGKTGTEGYFVVSLSYDFKYKAEHNVSYNVMINQKQGKYRYVLSDFFIYNLKTGPKSIQPLEGAFAKMSGPNKREFLGQLNTQVKTITDDLKSTLNSGKLKDQDGW